MGEVDEAPMEAAGEAPIEASGEAAMEAAAGEAAMEAAAREAPSEASGEAPVEASGEALTEAPGEALVEAGKSMEDLVGAARARAWGAGAVALRWPALGGCVAFGKTSARDASGRRAAKVGAPCRGPTSRGGESRASRCARDPLAGDGAEGLRLAEEVATLGQLELGCDVGAGGGKAA